MTTSITPDAIRAVADWYLNRKLSSAVASNLHTHADRLERELVDEKRIDELAKLFYSAEIHTMCDKLDDVSYPEYEAREEVYREGTRAGIRAVLAHLEQEHNPNDVDEDTARKSYQWDTLADVPDRITEVYRRTAGSTIFKRRDGKWFEQCGPRPEVLVSAGLIGPFVATPW